MNPTEQIRKRIESALSPSQLEVIDDSQEHIGHAGAQGGGHYTVKLASPAFQGKTLIECHRLVYAALGEMMQHEIHALRIKILS